LPCSPQDSKIVEGLAGNKYELVHDGSERAYSSVIDLRRAKILNHLAVAELSGTRTLLPFRFEDLNANGTARLLMEVEAATGFRARCEATLGRAPKYLRDRHLGYKKIIKHRQHPDDYIQWMNRYVDWEVEGRIGYSRREGTYSAGDVAVPSTASEPKAEPIKPVEQIILLGERHGGTNWITDHLTACFQEDVKVSIHYARVKHWFQEEVPDRVPENSAVVVAMFRDPYDWVEAMRVEPHHAHDHVDWNSTTIDYNVGWHEQGAPMAWKDFVTKPWAGRRGPADQRIAESNLRTNATCMDNYRFVDFVPCSAEDSRGVVGLGDYKYELMRDGSERAYSSVVDLRRDKILNHLSVAGFRGTRAFLPYRFEDLNTNGTGRLLREVEEATGFKPRCEAVMGKAHRRGLEEVKAVVKHGELPSDYVEWMSRYVDWEVERQIGYARRG